MRISLVLAALVSSAISVAAQQATPPATSPPATAPPSTATPATRPPAAQTPTTRPPSAKPSRASTPTGQAPTGERPPIAAAPQTAPSHSATPKVPYPGEKAPTAETPGWQNVRLDIKISDTVNPDGGKTVTFVCTDRNSGQVRSQSGDGLINIDAKPTVRADGRIWVQLTIEYRPELTTQQTQQSGSSRVAGFSESLSVVVVDGKPLVASQSADPRSDRKVSVEITATVQPIK
jgi:hypothetical protein